MNRSSLLFSLVLALSATSIASAQNTSATAQPNAPANAERHHDKAPMRERFQQMDSNHDGMLTQNEIGDSAPGLAKRFNQIDSNHDGKLSMEEIHQAKMQRKAMKAQRNQSKQSQNGTDPTSDAMDPESSDGQ